MALNENAKLWVAALRSGKYQQGRGGLCRGERRCCLGVGAEIAEEAGLKCHWRDRGSLPDEVTKWLGLADGFGNFQTNNLAHLNDDELNGKTFAEIADIIESEPEGLFA